MKAAIVLFALGIGIAHAKDGLIVHEWGTFTSVANENWGAPVSWAPLFGPADLPCFVQRNGIVSKGGLTGLVRMETPVLYFYSQRPTTLSVHVDFPKGQITEWYPRSNGESGEHITWDNVQVLPGTNPELPSTKGASHYFAARETDSAPIRVGKDQEKMIFYRGVGNFLPPLWPSYTPEGKLEIRNTGADTIPLAIVFENQGDKLGYKVVGSIKASVTIDPPEMSGNLDQLRTQLANDLVEFGLYKKEALAMIETWHDSWFEPGTRIFYILPTEQVNPLLPLTISPVPSDVRRVFVGRVEVLSPWSGQTIKTAMRDGDTKTLARFGRFLEPFLTQIKRKDPNTSTDQRANKFVMDARSSTNPSACVQ